MPGSRTTPRLSTTPPSRFLCFCSSLKTPKTSPCSVTTMSTSTKLPATMPADPSPSGRGPSKNWMCFGTDFADDEPHSMSDSTTRAWASAAAAPLTTPAATPAAPLTVAADCAAASAGGLCGVSLSSSSRDVPPAQSKASPATSTSIVSAESMTTSPGAGASLTRRTSGSAAATETPAPGPWSKTRRCALKPPDCAVAAVARSWIASRSDPVAHAVPADPSRSRRVAPD
mmetsp:Transcript_36291/g.111861  ORF Transcript_36291/g.111861 Transcript_36291/m.111861 type:complete len:229 (-) Transcript_36291:360-1046(-)